ncbi:MAG: hypothetical protein R3E98_20570 [Gemmatimonadota bacterium]
MSSRAHDAPAIPMGTNAEVAARLLEEAAGFFSTLAEKNEPLRSELGENASVFRQMGRLLQAEPLGQSEGRTHGALAGKLLEDAATFFRTLASAQPAIDRQLRENAEIYAYVGRMVAADPSGPLGSLDPRGVMGD